MTVSGLAASIRKASDAETFDFAGCSIQTIQHTIQDAFLEPFPQMVRLTFITGAGKLGRAKYEDGAAKTVTQTLQSLGYVEDRGASAILECQGSYKLQHDTGKNLKTVVVFPKVTGEEEAEGGDGSGRLTALLPEDSIQAKLAFSSADVFQKMMESQCPTWSQRKGCFNAISELKTLVDQLEGKLQTGQPLDDSEQNFYDSVVSLDDKLTFLKNSMHEMVDNDQITESEKEQLLSQVQEKITTLSKENKPKLLEKAKDRKEKLQLTKPVAPPPLKHEEAINELRKELTPLLAIEENAKGRLLTLKESQAMTRKDEIMEEIAELEQASQGWFESDEAFEFRLKLSRTAYQKMKTISAPKKKATATKSALPSTAQWVTSGAKKSAARSKPAKKAPPVKPGLFAAMMDDSDSD